MLKKCLEQISEWAFELYLKLQPLTYRSIHVQQKLIELREIVSQVYTQIRYGA